MHKYFFMSIIMFIFTYNKLTKIHYEHEPFPFRSNSYQKRIS
jgi:hypothetical protein